MLLFAASASAAGRCFQDGAPSPVISDSCAFRPAAAPAELFFETVTVGWNLSGKHLLIFEISWEDVMGSAMTCPETGERMPFNIKTDAKSVAQAWNQFIRVNCPHCGGRHDVLYKEVYMDGVLTGFQDDFALVLLDKRQRSRLTTGRKTPCGR
jgi:hypothetical protein